MNYSFTHQHGQAILFYMKHGTHERRPTVEIDENAKVGLRLIAATTGEALYELATEAAWMLIRKRQKSDRSKTKQTT